MIKLAIKSTDGERELVFADTDLLIGRAAECPIKLTDIKSSRKHARLQKGATEWRLLDLETPNGTKLNGRAVEASSIASGDEIRVGETTIVVLELDTPAVVRPKTEVLERPAVPIDKKLEVKERIDDVKRAFGEARARQEQATRSRTLPKVAAVAAALIVVALCAWVVISVADSGRPALNTIRAQRAEQQKKEEEQSASGHAQALFSELRQKADSLPTVTDAIITEVSEASIRYGAYLRSGKDHVNPFDQLLASLLQRRATAFASRCAQTRTQVESALAARKYGEVLALLASFRKSVDASYEDAVREIVQMADAHIDEDFVAVRAMGLRLEEAKRYAEAIAHYQAHGSRFAGTRHYDLIKDKPANLALLLKLEEEKHTLAHRPKPTELPSKEHQPTEPTSPPRAALTGLLADLAVAVRTGKFAGKTVKIDDARSGTPVGTTDDTVTFTSPSGEIHVPWNELSPIAVLRMATEVFHGDELLAVADWGYQKGLREESDKLLLRVDRKSKEKVDSVIAQSRGLISVPEGGYTWDPKHGWEDAVQRDNRTAAETAGKHVKDLIAANDAKKREALWAKFVGVYDRSTLTSETRETVKANTIAALKAWKKKNLETIGKKSKSMSTGNLYALKVELNKRRQAAIDLIYDEKIYVREDHPDYPKGDKVNGQEQVDALVDKVRAIWDGRLSVAVGLDSSVRRDVAEIREANEKYLAALGEEVSTDTELSEYETLVSNASEATINIRNFSLTAAEKAIYDWNRRVDRYNEICTDPGVTEEEKAHAKVLNDYREMMGRKRLFLDGRLCKATKKHSAVCDAAGQIWHVGSDGDPQSRARAEGFTAGVGENIAIGYAHPGDIWTRGWYRASDHHRNGLSDAWNCMGYGYVGRTGTQNFSNIGTPKGF